MNPRTKLTRLPTSSFLKFGFPIDGPEGFRSIVWKSEEVVWICRMEMREMESHSSFLKPLDINMGWADSGKRQRASRQVASKRSSQSWNPRLRSSALVFLAQDTKWAARYNLFPIRPYFSAPTKRGLPTRLWYPSSQRLTKKSKHRFEIFCRGINQWVCKSSSVGRHSPPIDLQ